MLSHLHHKIWVLSNPLACCSAVRSVTCKYQIAISFKSTLEINFSRYLAMSGLVDIWTGELAKLREKGQAVWSSGSSPTNVGSSKVVPGEEGSLRLVKPLPASIRGMQVKSPALTYSEASLYMLIDCLNQ